MRKEYKKVKNRMEEKRALQGSMTIEMALLIPLILTVIFGLLYFDFHTQNKVTVLCAAVEQAISGNEYDDIFLIGGANSERTSSESKSKRQVSFTSETNAVYGGFAWEINETAAYEILYPTDFVWKIKTLKKLRKS